MFCGYVVWAGMPIPPTFYLFTFLLLNVLWLRGMGKMPIPPIFYFFTLLLLNVLWLRGMGKMPIPPTFLLFYFFTFQRITQ